MLSTRTMLSLSGALTLLLLAGCASLPEDMRLIQSYDTSVFVKGAINEVYKTLAIAIALVVGVIFLFLGSARAMLVPAVTVPVSLIATFLVLWMLGFSINILTLLALVLAIGLVVDDAIVIGENIDAERAAGHTGPVAADRGAHGVLAPVVVGVMTTVAAFAPLLVTGGTFGDITRAIPLVVISVLLISLLEAFCILPSHLSHGGSWSRGVIKQVQGRIAGGMATLRDKVVHPGVTFAARWRYATVGLAVAFFILCMSLLANGHVRFIFFPQIEGNNISATLTMPEGTPFERTDAAVRRMVAAAEQVADDAQEEAGESLFVSITTTIGGRSSNNNGPGAQSSFSSSENIGQIRIELTPYGERQTPAADIERRWRTAVGQIEGAERVGFASGFVRFGSDIEFELAHQDEAALIAAADALKARLAGIDGVSQVEDSFDLGKRQLLFELTAAGRAAARCRA